MPGVRPLDRKSAASVRSVPATAGTGLDASAIRRALEVSGAGGVRSVQVFGRIDSTQAELQRQVRRGAGPVTVCVADAQTRGVGRGGRRWVSPPGANCYVSVLDRAARDPGVRPRAALWVGVFLAEALCAAGARGVRLKWPNDLLWQGAKLGGILVEGVPTRGDGPGLLVGVGLNLWLPPAHRVRFHRPVTDLRSVFEGEVPGTRAQWAARIVVAVMRAAEAARNAGGAELVSRWAPWDALSGRRIRLPGPGERIGIARGIDPLGRLRVETRRGVYHLTTLEERWVLEA